MQTHFTPNKVYIDGEAVRLEITRRNGPPSFATIDLEDLPKVMSTGRWTSDPHGYIVCTTARVKLHRLIMSPSDEMVVDHINHDVTDCRKSNLRVVSATLNMQNRKGARRDSASGVRGVYWEESRGKWRVEVRANKVRHRIGRFSTIEEAEAASIAARAWLHPNAVP